MTDVMAVTEIARRAVEAAARASLPHWRSALRVEIKPDRTPVTIADRESEDAIIDTIRSRFPDHAVLAEESGESGSGELRWIVDPLDGTRGFTRGGTFWGPLVAFEEHGVRVAGAMALPALGLVYWAGRGLGAWRAAIGAGMQDATRLQVSAVAAWQDATLSLGELRALYSGAHGSAVQALAQDAASVRSYGDVASAAMVLDGRAEVWLEAGVKPWDVAAFEVLFAEAGGRFSDFTGGDGILSGQVVGSNGRLHDHVLAALRG